MWGFAGGAWFSFYFQRAQDVAQCRLKSGLGARLAEELSRLATQIASTDKRRRALGAHKALGVVVFALDLHVGRRDDLLAGSALEASRLAVAVRADRRVLVSLEALVEQGGVAHEAHEAVLVPQLLKGRDAIETDGQTASSAAVLVGGGSLGVGS